MGGLSQRSLIENDVVCFLEAKEELVNAGIGVNKFVSIVWSYHLEP